jgi:CRISPR/Cas system-associated protein Cas5 (RAMP superfamily)
LVAVVVVIAPFAPLVAAPLGLTPPTAFLGATITAIVLGYLIASEAAKAVFYGRAATQDMSRLG